MKGSYALFISNCRNGLKRDQELWKFHLGIQNYVEKLSIFFPDIDIFKIFFRSFAKF